jgi:hypothetical protein
MDGLVTSNIVKDVLVSDNLTGIRGALEGISMGNIATPQLATHIDPKDFEKGRRLTVNGGFDPEIIDDCVTES